MASATVDYQDSNYWKRRYEGTWEASSKKEKAFRRLFSDKVHGQLINTGLGSESTSFIGGSASDNGSEKGLADFRLLGTNIFIEVTGPFSEQLMPDKPLWVRPDKIENARQHSGEHQTFVAHYCPAAHLWRCIRLDEDFFQRYLDGAFKTIAVNTQHAHRETYVEIPAQDRSVWSLDYLLGFAAHALTVPVNDIEQSEGKAVEPKRQPASIKVDFDVFGEYGDLVSELDERIKRHLGAKSKLHERYLGYRVGSGSKYDITIPVKHSHGINVNFRCLTQGFDNIGDVCTNNDNPQRPWTMTLTSPGDINLCMAILKQSFGRS